MEHLVALFEEFLMKGILMTEAVLNARIEGGPELDAFTSNRERLMLLIEQISNKIDWQLVEHDKRIELNRQIEYIKKLDEQLIVKLQDFQKDVRKDIEKTFRQKENIKGYNLNDVK